MGKISDALDKADKKASPLVQRGSENDAVEKQEDNPPLDLNSYKPKAIADPTPKKAVRAKHDALQPTKKDATAGRHRQAIVPPPSIYNEKHIDPNLIAFSKPESFEAEQFRMLRTNLLFPKNGKPSRSIMIASASPSEGKSFVAANLAISIAQNIDKYVLLIDCDMRSPSIHKLFGYESVAGLSNYLIQDQPLPTLIQKTFIERLSILPGGAEPPNPAELLTSRRMTDLLKEVKQRYSDRFIIIDTPPIQLTAEAQAIAKFADGILLVVRFGRANKAVVAKIAQNIGKDKILGVVGNFADRGSLYKNYAGKYSGYYGNYPKK